MKVVLFVCLCYILVGMSTQRNQLSQDSLERIYRVIGGRYMSSISESPWLTSLSGWVGREPLIYCGASILNHKWLLTAAHCVTAAKVQRWKVRMASIKRWATIGDKIAHGLGKLFNRKDWQQYEYNINKIIIHEGYHPYNTWENDIALIEVSGTIPVHDGNDAKIKAISLPDKNTLSFPADGQNCVMSGWGCDKPGGLVEYWAKLVILPKVNDADCARKFQTSTHTRLCAGYFKGNEATCLGDGGGPLVCKQGDKWIQAGILSFSSIDHLNYGAFTRVSTYVDWINDKIW